MHSARPQCEPRQEKVLLNIVLSPSAAVVMCLQRQQRGPTLRQVADHAEDDLRSSPSHASDSAQLVRGLWARPMATPSCPEHVQGATQQIWEDATIVEERTQTDAFVCTEFGLYVL